MPKINLETKEEVFNKKEHLNLEYLQKIIIF